MSVRRALVECAVLSLHDARVFYPCCNGCFSRIDEDSQDTTRCRCSRCGYSCPREQVDYRYRLSLKVARDRTVIGVTVFGTCLNSFFGIHASGLQRLVENSDGPAGASTRATLLARAVEDCFIGRHFIFGLKIPDSESHPLLNGSCDANTGHFVASQMILPKVPGLRGCSVISYYRILLQRAAEYELGCTDPSEPPRPPPTTLLLIPHQSPASSFNNTTLSFSGSLSQLLQRLQHQDSSLTPTPPWGQSLGLITSSAEQQEDCSTQESRDEDSRKADDTKTPHCAQRGEKRVPSFLLSSENTSYSFVKCPCSSVEPTIGNIPSPSPPRHTHDLPLCSEARSTRRLTETCLPGSMAWEDFPFSESLTEFLCEENKDFDRVAETNSHASVQIGEEKARNHMGVISQDKHLTHDSSSVCQSYSDMTGRPAQKLLDITNSANHATDRHDLSDQALKDPAGWMNKNQAKDFSDECNQGEIVISLPFENEKEVQLEGDLYNCSADLFSSSLMVDVNTNVHNTHGQTDTVSSEKAEAPPSASAELDWENKLCINRGNSLTPQSTQDQNQHQEDSAHMIRCDNSQSLDFIPSSQSTPVVKISASHRIPEFSSQPDQQDSSAFYRNMPQLVRYVRESAKENKVCGVTSRRWRNRNILKRRFWKPDENRKHLTIQRGTLNMESKVNTSLRCDSHVSDVTWGDCEDSDVIVPPTPVAETSLSVQLRDRRVSGSSSFGACSTGEEPQAVHCKRTLSSPVLVSSQTRLEQTGYGVFSPPRNSEATATAAERSLDGSVCYPLDENESCDWSRDLFSDSV
ncbi:uncharacterized protein ddias [Aulostomus maculatus]